MPSVQEMLKSIPTPQKDKGAKFCNAIDEDIYDSSDWDNNMPSDGYTFFQGEDSVLITYTSYFACYDGWDSMDNDYGEHESMHDAVKFIYDLIMEEERVYNLRKKLKKFKDIALDNVIYKSDIPAYFMACNVFDLELRYTKQSQEI